MEENRDMICAICRAGMPRLSQDQCVDVLNSSQESKNACSLCRQSCPQLDKKTLTENKVAASSILGKTNHLKANCFQNQDTVMTISQKVQDGDKNKSFFPSPYGSMDTLPLFKRDESKLKSPSISFTSENCCINTFINLSMFVLFIHCIIIGLGRIVAGYAVLESAPSIDEVHKDVALFQIIEGFIDISIIVSLLFANIGRRKCFPVLTLASILCVTYGSIVLWSFVSDDMFVLVSRYYSIFDWIMILYLIAFGYHMDD